MSFGDWLRKQREQHRLSQEKAAAEFDVTLRAWQYWESDVYFPRGRKYAQIIDRFGYPPAEGTTGRYSNDPTEGISEAA